MIIDPSDLKTVFYAIMGFAITQVVLFFTWLLKQVWGGIKKKDEQADKQIGELTAATQLNTLAVTKLTVQMQQAFDLLSRIPELERDIAKMGESYRALKSENHID